MLAFAEWFTKVFVPQRRFIAFCVGIALLSLSSASLSAAVIPNLFATGVDSTGASLSPGAIDPHYTIFSRSDGLPSTNSVVMDGHGWMSNNATSMWIWPGRDGRPSPLNITFRITFDLSGLDPNSASINGYWIVDNAGTDIQINGVSTGNSIPYKVDTYNPVSFSINNGFVSGINTLDFIVEDGGIIGGFRVSQITGSASLASSGGQVPEPTSITIFGLSILGLVCRGRNTGTTRTRIRI